MVSSSSLWNAGTLECDWMALHYVPSRRLFLGCNLCSLVEFFENESSCICYRILTDRVRASICSVYVRELHTVFYDWIQLSLFPFHDITAIDD